MDKYFLMCVVCEDDWTVDKEVTVCYTCPTCNAINFLNTTSYIPMEELNNDYI